MWKDAGEGVSDGEAELEDKAEGELESEEKREWEGERKIKSYFHMPLQRRAMDDLHLPIKLESGIPLTALV